jgi:hypothetical protein
MSHPKQGSLESTKRPKHRLLESIVMSETEKKNDCLGSKVVSETEEAIKKETAGLRGAILGDSKRHTEEL